jgi:hypothetical protein
MNKIINDLAVKATNDILGVKVLDKDVFARLIVEECAKICEELSFSPEGPSENAAYQRALCSISIKEHFGLVSKGPISARNI